MRSVVKVPPTSVYIYMYSTINDSGEGICIYSKIHCQFMGDSEQFIPINTMCSDVKVPHTSVYFHVCTLLSVIVMSVSPIVK